MASRNCPADETVDEYSMGMLQGATLDAFEEHLLVCSSCRGRLERADHFRDAFRAAHKVRERMVRSKWRLAQWFRGWFNRSH